MDLHGPGFESLLWRSRACQQARFRAIAASVPLAGRRIADLGCGRADLLAFLHERKAGGPEAYIGVDAMPEMVDYCRLRCRAEGLGPAVFLIEDFAAPGDLFARLIHEHRARVLIFSGSLNTFQPDDALDVLRRAWEVVGRTADAAMVFNFLSDFDTEWAPAPTRTPHMNTIALARWALDRTPNVRLRQGYLGGRDATIAMFSVLR